MRAFFARTLYVLLMLSWLLVLSSCASTDSTKLEGTPWKLTGWSISSQHAAATGITATFAHGNISGRTGLNTYGGTYAAAPDSALSIGSLASTQIGGPEQLMRAERAYLSLLAQVASYRTRDGTLTLYDKGGNESLIFKFAPK